MIERNEKLMWDQYHISKLDEADLDMRALKRKLGDKQFNKLIRFFKNLSKNVNDAFKDSQLYLT
jgi:hypothetical protein